MNKTLFIILFLCSSIMCLNAQQFRAVTLQKDTVDCFIGNGKTIFILTNIYSCVDCFRNLNNTLTENNLNDSTSEITIIALCRPSNSSSSARRSMLNHMKLVFPIANKILFEIQNDNMDMPPLTNEVFNTFGIDYSPALLVWDNNNYKPLLLLKYNNLFDRKGKVLQTALSKILEIVK